MARDLEAQLRYWAKPPGDAEQQRMDNAESMIRDAIGKDPKLGGQNVSVFAQGSYKNLTYIPGESDVDVCVVYRDAWYSDWDQVDPAAKTDPVIRARLMAEANIVEVQYRHAEFRDDVGVALVRKFGPDPAVKRGDKVFDIRRNSYHVDADVLAAMEHRRYRRIGGVLVPTKGVQFWSDEGVETINFPEEQYDNGVTKNKATGGRFKDMVRIVKNVQVEMDAAGVAAAKDIPSFLSECLVYNAPDSAFGSDTYTQDVKDVLFFLWSNSKADDAPCSEWVEESGLKWLLKGRHDWTRAQVHAFLKAAWNHLELPTE